jgi:P4 family phage/plasmid primase-like protien
LPNFHGGGGMKMDIEQKQKDAEKIIAKKLLDELQFNVKPSREHFDKLKNSYLEGKVSWEAFQDYFQENPVENLKMKISNTLDKRKLAQEIIRVQPCFFDSSKMWWIWDFEKYKWSLVDETDILNAINREAEINTINSKEKTEILEALKQVGRENQPKEIKKTWVQFFDKIVDVATGEKFDASPDYFVTNPIPYKTSDDEGDFETPVMDKIFEQWVGKENKMMLYEILAYCLLPSYPIHRIFCFIGGGMNGKSCFLNLLRKFVGKENCCASELDTLLQSRFEVTRLHKKLVCQMGETNFSEMEKTSILKKLSGGDLVGFEYKNKNPFEEINYAKIIIATNNLPSTTDKTIGFYRRWMIIDFPNQFSEKSDILSTIPEEEFNALASRSFFILRRLLKERGFTNEGSIEDRVKKYEDRSNPLELFIKEFMSEEQDCFVFKKNFSNKFNEWATQKRFRGMSDVEIGKKMKQLGIGQGLRSEDWTGGKRYPAWLGLRFKNDVRDRDDRDDRAT